MGLKTPALFTSQGYYVFLGKSTKKGTVLLLLLCNNSPQTAHLKQRLLSHRFLGSRIWAQLSWMPMGSASLTSLSSVHQSELWSRLKAWLGSCGVRSFSELARVTVFRIQFLASCSPQASLSSLWTSLQNCSQCGSRLYQSKGAREQVSRSRMEAGLSVTWSWK